MKRFLLFRYKLRMDRSFKTKFREYYHVIGS